MGKLDLSKISLTTGITGAILFVLCYLLYWAAPMGMYSVGTRMFHGIQMISQFNPSFGGFVLGLIYTFIGAYIVGAIYVWVYNNINKK